MGVLRFRVYPSEYCETLRGLKTAYVTGLDRTPNRTTVEIRRGVLTCYRDNPESGRLHVSWPVPGFGMPVLSTTTLGERSEPYDLVLELARGRLNDVRNQASDWAMMGLQTPAEIGGLLSEAQKSMARAVTSREDQARMAEEATACLGKALRASEILVQAYTQQLLERRREYTPKLPTLLSCKLEGDPRKWAIASRLKGIINAGRVDCSWSRMMPSEGQTRWDEVDAQVAWCRANRLTVTAGPLVDLRPGGLPDWLWLFGGDYEGIQGMMEDFLRQVIARFRGKVSVWHLIHRMGIGEVLGLHEEDQVRLTARALQVARQVDPHAQFVVDFERPWAGWLASSTFQLGPLHLADSLARADLGLSGVGLEIAPGYSPPGSRYRDLLDYSRLLDLFALVNLPLHVTLAMPSSPESPPGLGGGEAAIRSEEWPGAVTERSQMEVASRWIALTVAKPYVRSVHWNLASDASGHLFANSGLFRADNQEKPLAGWLRDFRGKYLEPFGAPA